MEYCTPPLWARSAISITASCSMVSELEVLQVGGPIEEVDMHDIQQGIDQAQHEDIKTAYQNLMCGSRNQPRAFVGAIERQHADYQAQYLAQDEFDAIVDSPWSTAASAKTQQTGTVRAVPVCCVLASGSRSKRCAKRWGGEPQRLLRMARPSAQSSFASRPAPADVHRAGP